MLALEVLVEITSAVSKNILLLYILFSLHASSLLYQFDHPGLLTMASNFKTVCCFFGYIAKMGSTLYNCLRLPCDMYKIHLVLFFFYLYA